MAGRNKQPLSVIQGKGKSHHITKEEAKRRIEHEERMKGDTDKIEAPDFLLKKQKTEFDYWASELMKLDIFSNLDVDALGFYIEAKTEWIRLGPVIRKLDPIKNIDEYTKLRRERRNLSSECRSFASDLGLTITSRLKLVIPKTEDSKPENKFKKFAK